MENAIDVVGNANGGIAVMENVNSSSGHGASGNESATATGIAKRNVRNPLAQSERAARRPTPESREPSCDEQKVEKTLRG